jgi:hypothetical protein
MYDFEQLKAEFNDLKLGSPNRDESELHALEEGRQVGIY